MNNLFLFKSVVAVSIFTFSSSNAATLYVEKWGNETGVCTAKDPCDEISTALGLATPNSRIIVGPGRYDGGLTVQTSGIKIESTGGPQVTIIDGANAGSGTIGVDIQADKVSIGKTKGKGFTITSENAEIIKVGTNGDLTGCSIGSFSFDGEEFFFANEDRSPPLQVSGTRIEGNNLLQRVNAEPSSVGFYCQLDDFNAPTSAELVTIPALSGISVVGDGVILTGNNIVGGGTNVLDLTSTLKRSTVKGNNIKHDYNGITSIAGYPFSTSNGGIFQYIALDLNGDNSSLSGNYIELIGDPMSFFTVGLNSQSQKAKITSNIVENFGTNINVFGSPTISKNVIVNPSIFGISDFASDSHPSITDNTIYNGNGFSGSIGIYSTNTRFIRGNNISGFKNSEGLVVNQREPLFSSSKLKFSTISNNNFYDLDNNAISPLSDGKCGIYFDSVELPTKMSKNFFGSTSESPQIKESTSSSSLDVPSSLGSSWHICAANGLVNNTTTKLEITNVTTRPSLKANRVRALFRANPF